MKKAGKTAAAHGRETALGGARRRLEDVKLLSIAASLLAFGGLTATAAVGGSSLAVKPATTTSAQPGAPDQLAAPVAAAPPQSSVGGPAPANHPIVSAQS